MCGWVDEGYIDVDRAPRYCCMVGGGGETIVSVRGLPLIAMAWRRQSEHFNDCRNVAVDLRGYGSSSTLPPDAWDVTGLYVDDPMRLLAQLGEERAAFVGHASGGHGVLRLQLTESFLRQSLDKALP
jgi:pimeloyl-ACP methyl ester carboxylesterase